ncbi:MAG TPA: hypothetical protein VKU01_34225 [Bryobacteraceae bacterium]|nr:hypothetical protein [Bryobacteraceae bacterium]
MQYTSSTRAPVNAMYSLITVRYPEIPIHALDAVVTLTATMSFER